jgi:AmiR/NasT family two-component response regulator
MPSRVVIADDELLVAMQLQSLMVSLGYEVVGRANTGKEAVGLCCSKRPDLALMDVRMPEMDGLVATRSIVETCPTCVIMVAGSPHYEQAAVEAGAMAYVVKPAGPEIASVAETARKRFRCFQMIRDRIGEMDGTLATWGLAWQAVKGLMRKQGMSEEEACDELKRLAAGDPASMRQAAEDMLASLSGEGSEGPAPPAEA